MNVYRLLKSAGFLRSPRLRLLGLCVMYALRRRCLGVYVDSVYACNYRCRMCYFSNEEHRRERRGKLSADDLDAMADALLPHALKLQVGCGAEPTMDYDGMLRLIRLGKKYGVPYISITTNGALLDRDRVGELARIGLDEITLSLHGIHEDTYEHMMGANGKYEHFRELLRIIRDAKKEHPALKLRINYTMNADNVEELADWDMLFENIAVDVVQLRPVQRIGNSVYDNFDLTAVREALLTVVQPLTKRLRSNGTTVIAPEEENIDNIESRDEADNATAFFNTFAYCNISPTNHWQDDFDYHAEDFTAYCRRHRIGWQMLKTIVSPGHKPDILNSFLMKPTNYRL